MEPVAIATNKTGVFYNAGFQLLMLLCLFFGGWGSLWLTLLAMPVLFLFLFSIPQWVRTLTTPALVADEYGVTDATGAVPGGLVYWSEIAAIETVETPAETLLLLRLHDVEAYLARLPEPMHQMLAGSASVYGTPCVVAQNDIAVPVGDALRTLTDARARFAGARLPVAVTATSYDAPVSAVAPAPTVSAAHWWTSVPPEERAAKPVQQVGRNGDR